MSQLRNQLITILFAWILLLCSQAQAAQGSAPALYSAQKDSIKIYLLGSIHAGRASFYPLAAHIQQVFNESDELILEVTPDQMVPQYIQPAMMKYGVLSVPKPLSQRMPAETYTQVEKLIKEAGLPAHQMAFMRDWSVLLQMTMAMVQKMGLRTDKGIDQYFSDMAARQKKPMYGLETLEFQFEVLASMDELGPELLYGDFVHELDFAQNWLLSVEQAWRSGDSLMLNRLYAEYDERQQQAEFSNKLLRDRNQAWSKQLLKLPAKTYMMVVGDMHIHGNDSVLDFLRESGFIIKRVYDVEPQK